jgi:mannose-1-phosphate guanylyltransferase/mannose-6-phosphate isomerase
MIIPVILAGGFGKRLHPLSTEKNPKQFLKILGNYSTFQSAVLRAMMMAERIIISCNSSLEMIARRQLGEINADNFSFIFEDIACNTAMSIIISALCIIETNQDASILIFPADHIIEDIFILKEKITELAEVKDRLILFGIRPLWQESSYGYIQIKTNSTNNLQEVEKFIEKPNTKQIQQLLSDNLPLYWNSGIFFFPISFFLQEVKKHNEDILSVAINHYHNAKFADNDIYLKLNDGPISSNISIDYLLLEKSSSLLVSELDITWRDIGSWGRLLDFFYRNYNNQSCDISPNIEKLWGNYFIITKGDRFLVKIMNILPGKKTSLQYHRHRSECSMVTEGKAKIIIDPTFRTKSER